MLFFWWAQATAHAGGDATAGGEAAIPLTTCTIVQSFPHDAKAFTQGLLFHEGYLYESLGGYGRSSVRKVQLTTGQVLEDRPLEPRFFGEGLALVQDQLLQLTWKAGRGFRYRRQGLEPVGGFTYAGEGWGLTMGPTHLYMTQGKAELLVLDPRSLAVKRRVPVRAAGKPIPLLNELEWVEGRVWANIWQTPYIAVIQPETGRVERFIDLTPCVRALPPERPGEDRDVPNGIAYDAAGKRLFVTGKRWPRLFQIALPE